MIFYVSIMQRRKIARHPIDGDSALLVGTRDALGPRYRREIENNYLWWQHQRELAVAKVLSPGFAREDSDWGVEAACQNCPDPEVFFPVTDEAKAARAWEPFCSVCPVLQECAAYAKQLDLVGIWGGQPVGVSVTRRGRPRNFYEPGSAAERRYFRQRAQREARKAMANG